MAQLSSEELNAFRATAVAFGKRRLKPWLERTLPDGDPAEIPALLAEARQIGLLAAAGPDEPGGDTGVWGRQSQAGPGLSLALLSTVAESCAGIANCLHQAGLGASLLALDPDPPAGLAAPALTENGFLPDHAAVYDPGHGFAAIETRLEAGNGGHRLSGRKSVVLLPPGTKTAAVFARDDEGWALAAADLSASGVSVREVGPALGLTAARPVQLDFERAPARRLGGRCDDETMLDHLARHWYGQVAIAAGTAAGAVAEAVRYASERYQGGTEIIRHPAVAMMLAEAQASVAACRALLPESEPRSALEHAASAAEAKIAGLPLCCRAVTECLQVLGGYGYMEDYGLEKRYRDVHTLRCAGGSPAAIRQFVASLRREEKT